MLCSRGGTRELVATVCSDGYLCTDVHAVSAVIGYLSAKADVRSGHLRTDVRAVRALRLVVHGVSAVIAVSS